MYYAPQFFLLLTIESRLEDKLKKYLIQLRPKVTSKWRQFGMAAGVPNEVLENIATTNEDCLAKMLEHWLKNSTEEPTWTDVARILRQIELGQLASVIERTYITSN